MVNLGGGFPTKYLRDVPVVEAYGRSIFRALRKHFGNRIPETIIEPGRGMVGNAGVIEAEVVLVSNKSEHDHVRWVYLDIGKFGGLAETMDELIRYPIKTPHDGDEVGPCVLAGPTCDSADVLYEKRPYDLPISLEIGDKVLIEGTGAYTATYAAVAFNGFAPLRDLSHLTTADLRLRRPPTPCGGREGRSAGARRSERSGSWSPFGKRRSPTSPPAKRCSIWLTARRALPRRPSGCAKAACRPTGCRWSRSITAASSAPSGFGTSPRGRGVRRCCSARSRSIRSIATAASARRWCAAPLRAPASPAIAPSSWSATRPITAASASPPKRPANCGCPAASSATGCWRSSLSPEALTGARGLIAATGAFAPKPDLNLLIATAHGVRRSRQPRVQRAA